LNWTICYSDTLKVWKKLIDYDAAYSSFSYYLTKTYEHPEIRKYISDPDNNDTYEDFPLLYKRFKGVR
jgi:hypothetical protein